MRYVLRADASPSIGTGHVMRSSAIAEELINRGEEVVFVGQISNLTWVEERIEALGFSEIFKNPLEFVSDKATEVLILDSYEISRDDAFIAPSNWLHIVTIVDEQTPNYLCELRIHPGLDSSWVGDSIVPILAGPRFIPLRASLSQNIKEISRSNGVIRIAVVAGGSDPYELVYEITKILEKSSQVFEVLLFSNSTLKEALDQRFKCVAIGASLDVLTQNVDLVLTTSSMTSLEFIARGLCVAVACAVDNQKQNYDSLGKIGAAAQIGFRNASNVWELNSEVIYSLIESPDLRAKLISNSRGLIDFQGASRIADAIQTL
jgi:spore coat polysaccharide biosynthesis predicted glycosyltransferase SpsG